MKEIFPSQPGTALAEQNGTGANVSLKWPRVAVLFQRLGPYHHARLNAAGSKLEIIGVEACGMEDVYAWERVEGAESFRRITISERQVNDAGWRRQLRCEVRRVLSETKPGAVALPGWSSLEGLTALSWCVETGTPAIMMSESTEWDEQRSLWKEWLKKQIVRLCAAGLVGGTPHAAYLEKLGIPSDRIFVGYDVVDNEYFANATTAVRDQHSRPSSIFHLPSSPFFLASARFVEKKNLYRLIQAYARYRELACAAASPLPTRGRRLGEGALRSSEAHEKVQGGGSIPEPISHLPSSVSQIWRLVLLGDGPLRESLNSQLSTLRLHEHVLMPGFKQYDELPSYYAHAGAFVHASTTEQWGLVVNEAMASGLPVLVSNRCGCAQDLVREGVNGFTFDPYDIEQLAQLMLKLSTLNSQLPMYASSSPPRNSVSASDGEKVAQPDEVRKTAVGASLESFGAASRNIISNWGPDRFADGLQKAVAVALARPVPKASWLDRLLLRLLILR